MEKREAYKKNEAVRRFYFANKEENHSGKNYHLEL